MRLAFRKEAHAIYVYNNTSKEFCADIVTQKRIDQLSKNIDLQLREPMAFLESRITGSRQNWTIYERKVYAIVQSFYRMCYIL